MSKIIERCQYCRTDTETVGCVGGDCKVCGFSKAPPKTICSFCGEDKTDVKNLIAGGPNYNELKGDDGKQVYICNECVDMCSGLIQEKAKTDALNAWLGNNGNEDNEESFNAGWENGLKNETADFADACGFQYDWNIGFKLARKYLDEKKK